MASSGGGTPINFLNYCLLCLEPESPTTLLDLLKTNPNSLRTFQPVLHYLSGSDPTYSKSQLECQAKGLPVMANLPPLCLNCYNLTSSIYRLHAELLHCQVNIQQKTEQVRKVVSSTKKYTHPPHIVKRTRRNLFLHRLLSSGRSEGEVDGMRRFVQNLHDIIIEQGTNKVIFPSEPPPNFIPLPPKVHPPPVTLSQLPVPSPPSKFEEESPPSPPQEIPPSPPGTPSPLSPSPPPPSSPSPVIISVVSKAVLPSPPTSTANTSPIKPVIRSTPTAPASLPQPKPGSQNLEKIIPRKKRKIRLVREHHHPPPPSPLPPPSPIIPPPPKSPPHPQPQPPQIFPAPLLQYQAAQILLHLSVPFIRPPFQKPSPPPKKLPIPPKPSPTLTRQLPCEICSEYRPLNHIKPHLLAVHSGVQGHSCPTCHKIFISNSRLIHHWQTRKKKCAKTPKILEHLQKFYHCPICPSPEIKHTLTQMSTHIFSTHERDPTLPKSHICGICNLKFRTPLGLDFHLNLHTHPSRRLPNQQKFQSICPPDPNWRKKKKLKFFQKPNFNNLKAPCDQCQVNYNCRDLENHLTDKHAILKENLEKCSSCLYRSTKKESLLKHIKICHKKETTPTINQTSPQPPFLKEKPD